MTPTAIRPSLRRTARRLLAVAAVATLLASAAVVDRPAPAAAAGYTGPHPGTFTGLGFDTCAAPSNTAMKAWLQSPYRAVGIYIGGVNRGCAQANLTKAWVSTQQAAGWRFFPLYVGLQAPCSSYQRRIDPARAAVQGREAADDAATSARNLGLAARSTIILDLERYPAGNVACTGAVDTFVSAWTGRLHEHGFLAGLYTSVESAGLADQVAAYARPGYARPDLIDFARWDGVQTVSDEAIPASYWPRRRMKQYRGDHHETWGGVRINIDSNYLELEQPAYAVRTAQPQLRRYGSLSGTLRRLTPAR
ncbi:protein of unknown function [Micromonospora echinaurantiaca]|uniref:Rv2525c-like glycoside hydrolase-like domain-containing protein n=1 Tax=Micromonospora echinaurantiaca TaxID=47857 RepID=A0A1C5K7S3_9ACTN|nr:DUF1906 domain-containing protein [Micromonospora echinaurantiaca]SCG78823.1 protein of unknown function [Micromonospora echinaurantiaca]